MEKIKLWENVIKGWILSLVGLIIVVADLGDLVGFWSLPVYSGTVLGLEVTKPIQMGFSAAAAILLFWAPQTVEGIIEKRFKGEDKK